MTSAGSSLSRVPIATGANPPRRIGGFGWRRYAYLAGAGLALAVLILGARTVGRTWFEPWFGAQPAKSEFHAVAPTTLNITLTESGELKPRQSAEIKCEVEGQTAILYLVPESTHVKQGDLLVELSTDELEDRRRTQLMEVDRIKADYEAAVAEFEIQRNQNDANIRAAGINLEVAKLDLEKYLNGDFLGRQKEINVNIQQSEMDIARKVTELEENRQLETKGWVTSNYVKDLEFALNVARLQLERHQLSKEILLNYERPMIEMQRKSSVDRTTAALEDEKKRAASLENKSKARVEQFEKQLVNAREGFDRIEKQIAKCKMYAPADGVVRYPVETGYRLDTARLAAGETVRKGQTLVILPDTSRMIVATRIHEADRHLVHEGLPCFVNIPAAPGETFTGSIVKIDKYADSENLRLNPALKEHGAEILLDQTDAPLSPGDSAEITILIDKAENVLAVPVQCVVARGPRSYVFPDAGEPLPVKVGRTTTNLVEIVEGLTEGQLIRMTIDEQRLAELPTAGQSATLPDLPAGREAEQARDDATETKSSEAANAQPPPISADANAEIQTSSKATD